MFYFFIPHLFFPHPRSCQFSITNTITWQDPLSLSLSLSPPLSFCPFFVDLSGWWMRHVAADSRWMVRSFFFQTYKLCFLLFRKKKFLLSVSASQQSNSRYDSFLRFCDITMFLVFVLACYGVGSVGFAFPSIDFQKSN